MKEKKGHLQKVVGSRIDGSIKYEIYCLKGKKHNRRGPAHRTWYDNGQLEYELHFIHGRQHSDHGPAVRKWDRDGRLIKEEHWINGMQVPRKFFEDYILNKKIQVQKNIKKPARI